MPEPVRRKELLVALAGNPNVGKTSLFNALTGAHQKVGNYPGVTVEKLEGTCEAADAEFRIVDLPGIYSLTAYSLDEVVTRDFLLEEKPDIIIDVLDSTNLERNLYLFLQFQELGIPIVGALNMSDEAEAKGLKIRADLLAATLGAPMIKTVGSAGKGKNELLAAVKKVAESGGTGKRPEYGDETESRLAVLQPEIEKDREFIAQYPSRWISIKLLENDRNAIDKLRHHSNGEAVALLAEESRKWISRHFGKDSEIIISEQRYGYINGALKEAVRKTPLTRPAPSERIDRVLMDQWIGLPIFFLVIWGMFKLTFGLGAYPARLLEAGFGALAALAGSILPAGAARSLIVNGVIGGVGGVLSFVPYIVILFLCISILEDTGYMSRAAFLTDKALHAFGLHGQSFMPLMLGFGCTVPALMAARTLKSPRDRLATILAVPFMSCGAKLPVYVLIAGTFFPDNAGNVVMAMYLGGAILSMLSTLFLRRTVLRGESTPFVMELPTYRLPTLRGIFWHVWGKTWQYMKKAGTVILAASVIMWIITNYPAPEGGASVPTQEERLEYSIAGRVGKFIEPALRLLGFNWKTSVALIPGLAAKELVVSTLGILYSPAETKGGEIATLQEGIRSDPTLNPAAGLAIMVFILVMPPCLASLATIRSEAGGKWLAFQIAYSLALAWILALLVRLAFGAFA